MKIKKPFTAIKKSIKSFLKRRPHRSFRLTKRRDYDRSLKLTGYFKFNSYVWKKLWSNRKVFLRLAFVYCIITALMVGVASQDLYQALTDTLDITGDGLTGVSGELSKAGLLLITAITGGINQNLTDIQQVYAGIIIILMWLTTVWLLRNILAGHKVKLRDGLYNAGAPILSMLLVSLLLLVQSMPIAFALIGYGAALTSGLLASGGVPAMLYWIFAGLLSVLSLYWITGTFFALIIITIPGTYPMQAVKSAGDLVVGRRFRILFRMFWMLISVALTWGIVLISVIMFDGWIKSMLTFISWFPTIPILLLILTAFTIIWISSYVYLLYREVVADGATPN